MKVVTFFMIATAVFAFDVSGVPDDFDYAASNPMINDADRTVEGLIDEY